ncbi:MAG TPA: hypothetical protein VNI34_04915 [Candidatus Nitrosotalea sp.]|nr:hypothetical protein [Candidatus Nitrosotalea sp.]
MIESDLHQFISFDPSYAERVRGFGDRRQVQGAAGGRVPGPL